MKNTIPKGFLKQYRYGDGEEFGYIILAAGFLRLEYDTEAPRPLLSRVSFVAAPNPFSNAIEEQLECNLSFDGADDEITFIKETGVSGTQWCDGQVRWGHTYDDENDTLPEGRKIALDEWVDECIEKMINPSPKILRGITKGYNLKNKAEQIKSGNETASEDFWKNCNPATEEDVALTLEILQEAIERNDGNALFSCCNPLKRASIGQTIILDALTSLLEKNRVANDFDRSELHEIIEAHATCADKELEKRWLNLCKKAYKQYGPEFFQVIYAGHLIGALTKVKAIDTATLDFFKDIVAGAKSKSYKNKDYSSYISYLMVLKALNKHNLQH